MQYTMLQTTILSDGSKAYSLKVTEKGRRAIYFACVDEKAAEDLANSIENCTVGYDTSDNIMEV